MKNRTKALRLLAAWAILLAIVACGGSGAEPTEEEQARSEALRELESHLAEASTYGEGPGGSELATGLRETLAPGDGVAVRVIPGQPRNVVVLIRYRSTDGYQDLREISVSERNEEIDRIVTQVDQTYGATADNLAVAIRGAVFYGALGVRQAGQAIQYHTGSVVSLSPLDPILTATPGEDAPVPALTLNEQVQGTVVGPPGNPPTYQLELAEETLVVAQFIGASNDDPPFLAVCSGAHRGRDCNAQSMDPMDDFYNDGLDALAERTQAAGRLLDYQAYRLAAGTYTFAVLSNCDWEGPCANDGTAFTLMPSTPRSGD